MTVKNVVLLAARMRKMKAKTINGHYKHRWCSDADYENVILLTV
jgi:hypothetical protein